MPRTVHLICNAHLDPVWLWEWEEGAATALSTFRTAADLCEEFDTFVFNHNEAILYSWIEEYEPALFERIRRLVKEGRWHIMGGWYLQPDCNMPSGESFVRQILLGRRYFAEKFGARPTTAINFDPFGHTRGLVQIMARSGFDSYIICRPGANDIQTPPGPYWWEGYDGSRVRVLRPSQWYNSPLGKAREKVLDYQFFFRDEDPGLILWGVGDHGGGASRQDLQDLKTLLSSPEGAGVRHSTPETYFAELAASGKELPVHRGDLNPWAVGCYTSMAQVKQRHRQLENRLYAAEKIAAAAWRLAGLAYPRAELGEALRDLATAEFHDSLPGSSIQPVEEMALRLMDHGLELCSRVQARAFFALAQGQPAARPDEIPILVYNPHPYPVESVVECEFNLADFNPGEDTTLATAYRGQTALPSQVEKELSSLALDWRKRVVFRARLEPGQMNRFDCRLERVPQRPRPQLQPQAGRLHFRSSDLSVQINTRTGLIDSYQVDGHEYLRPGACRPRVMQDDPDPWGMRTRSYRQAAGAFRLLSPARAARFAGLEGQALDPVRVIEDGAVRTVVEALFGYRDSYLCLRYKLPKQGAEVEIEARVHWGEKDCLLKLAFPAAERQARFLGQVAYGAAELPENGDEAVAQKWLALAGAETALTIINDRTYAADYDHNELRLTLLRSPGYSVHPIKDRPLLPNDRYSPRHDQGERIYHFWLQGGPRQARLGAVDREALAHNETPVALSFFPAGGGQPLPAFATLSDAVIQVSAIKPAEDGEDLVVRLFEPSGTPRSAVLRLPWAGMEIPLSLGAFEVATLKIDWHAKTWQPVNLIEEG